MYIYIYTHTHTHIHTRGCVCVCVCIHKTFFFLWYSIPTQAQGASLLRFLYHTIKHTITFTQLNTHNQSHTYTHTHTHTHTPIYVSCTSGTFCELVYSLRGRPFREDQVRNTQRAASPSASVQKTVLQCARSWKVSYIKHFMWYMSPLSHACGVHF